ncbi:hypothetical protein EOPP23_14880 [Endozoicomonas sp. OPT23]|uniref:O-antigen ligase family protein n=1 Tax=Endozoicomonas sp. OPT23 TaxID=2072845 RepID=UPI00129A8C64|nr:O-antigen ligase family protein [Endozoicomonas sp. OPT23]MRI34274.1 hypothetical protein [Endozoicomonas sp. OPT23]
MSYNKSLFWLLLLVLAWLPLPYGSNTLWSKGLLIVLVQAISVLWLLGFALGKCQLTPVFRKSTIPLVLLFSLSIWVFIQGDDLAGILPASLVFDVFATRLSFWLTLSYSLLFALVLLLVTNSKRLKLLGWAFVISGTFQAVFGVLSTLSGVETLLFSPKETYFGVATGTYVNRNSFAGCMEMTLAMGMGLLIAQLNDKKAASWSEWLLETLKTLMSSKVLLRSALAIMVIGLVVSKSRMGNTAFFSSLMLTGLLYVVLRKKLTRSMVILFVSLIAIDTLIVSQWFGLEKVVNRLEQTSLQKETRPNVAEVTLQAIPEHAVTGTGVGSYYTVLPQHHDGSWRGFYDLAHNDFLQFALEFGVPAFALLVLLVLMSAWMAIATMRKRNNRLFIGMAFSSFMGVSAIMIHSSVDFNLQIPANAAYFVCLLAMAWVVRYLPSKKSYGR